MKNILYLSEGSGFAGSESYSLNLIEGLSSINDLELSCALFYSGPIKEKLSAESVKILELCGKNNFKSIGRIVRHVRARQVDLIHFIDLKSTIVGGIAALFLKNVKTVATVHGLPEWCSSFSQQIKYAVSLLIYFLLLKFSVGRVICVSEDLRRRLQKIVGPGKVQVIHNGVSLKNLGGKHSDVLPKRREFIVGTVGRLEKVKGYTFLLGAAEKVMKVRNDVVFHIIGDGPLKDELIEQAKLQENSDKIRFLGFRDDVLDLTASMDILVLPSLHEGIPYALLEAMACSKPVICTNVGGMKEVISHGIDGLLIPPEDPLALSQAILDLLDAPDYAADLGRNARKKIEAQFSSESMARETHALYVRLAGGGA